MMMDYIEFIPRLQAAKLRSSLKSMRVVVLTGARQTGKTTLAQEMGGGEDRTFLSLDSPETLLLATRDPSALWEGLDLVTIDEVQRSPDLLNHIKIEVDRNPRRGRFLLTGSANLLLMKSVSESLAGRAGYIVLPSLTLAEIMRREGGRLLRCLLEATDTASVLKMQADFEAAIGVSTSQVVFDGGYPEAIQLPDDDARNVWREGYVATYLERDLRNLSQIADLPDFLRLMRLAALRAGQVLNIDGVARDAGLSSSTARRYLNLLEVSWLTVTIPAYSASRSKRLIKSPKLYCTDSGLACYLAGITSAGTLEASPQFGSLLETYILQNILAFAHLLPGSPQVLYWRTVRGQEVDFVLETADRLLPFEVKSSRTLGKRDLHGLEVFLREYPEMAPFGVILYAGKDWLRPARDIVAIPWSTFITN